MNIIANSDDNVFSDASVKTVVFVLSNKSIKDSKITFFKIKKSEFIYDKEIEQNVFIKQDYLINEKVDINAIGIINKLNKNKFIDEFYEVKNGIKVRKELLFENKTIDSHKPFLLGKNIFTFNNTFDNIFIDYKIENEKLYTNQAFRNKEIFEQNKLISRQILGKRIVTTYDENNFYTDQTTYVINRKNKDCDLKYLLCLLNSKLIYYYFINTTSDNKIVFPKVKRSQILELPFIKNKNQQPFIEQAEVMLSLSKEFQLLAQKFSTYFSGQFKIEKLSGKLEKWYDLSFDEFMAAVNKVLKTQKGTPLTKKEEFDWIDLFEENKAKANQLQNEIATTDKAIDAMVYELYGLTEDEIQIVEQS